MPPEPITQPKQGRSLPPALLRLRGLLWKETLQILRDPSSIALALVMPLVLLVLFGFGVTFDAENIQTALVLADHGVNATRLASAFTGSRYFQVRRVETIAEAAELLSTRKVACVVQVQSDFDTRLMSGLKAPVQVILDGVDANRAQLISGYAGGVVQQFNVKRMRDDGMSPAGGAVLDSRVWFNAELDSQNSLVPGLLALILTLTGVLLTALVFVRERERGTLEAVLVTPVRPTELMLAKLLPYFLLGMIGLISTTILARVMFDIPLRGSWGVLLLTSSVFMLASLGIGLLISVVAPSQMVASQISVVIGFLPAFFLSGLLFDLLVQPGWTRAISRILPTTYFIDAAKTIFLAGDDWRVLRTDVLALSVMAVVLLTVVRLRIRKRLV